MLGGKYLEASFFFEGSTKFMGHLEMLLAQI
jgi:hypothetical protein